jgi:hypothetical protein
VVKRPSNIGRSHIPRQGNNEARSLKIHKKSPLFLN